MKAAISGSDFRRVLLEMGEDRRMLEIRTKRGCDEMGVARVIIDGSLATCRQVSISSLRYSQMAKFHWWMKTKHLLLRIKFKT